MSHFATAVDFINIQYPPNKIKYFLITFLFSFSLLTYASSFGRKGCAVASGALYAVFAMLISCAPSLNVYLALRGVLAVFEECFYVACYVLSESCYVTVAQSLVHYYYSIPDILLLPYRCYKGTSQAWSCARRSRGQQSAICSLCRTL